MLLRLYSQSTPKSPFKIHWISCNMSFIAQITLQLHIVFTKSYENKIIKNNKNKLVSTSLFMLSLIAIIINLEQNCKFGCHIVKQHIQSPI